MWPFKKALKFKVGDRVRVIGADGLMEYFDCVAGIGKTGTVEILPSEALPSSWAWNVRLPPSTQKQLYVVRIDGAGPCAYYEHHLKRIDDDDFPEPRDMSDETPNKVVSWDSVPFKPTREKA